MTLRRLIYEGDSLIHAPPVGTEDAAKGAAETARPTNATTAKRRAEALRSFFPKLAVWLNNRIHFARMREVESYLAEATDLADLERRIANVDRGARWH